MPNLTAAHPAMNRWAILSRPLRGVSFPLERFHNQSISHRSNFIAIYFFFAILAQVSLKVTVRLKTSLSAVESVSGQKYPWRSNW